jgi:hypothetical protein
MSSTDQRRRKLKILRTSLCVLVLGLAVFAGSARAGRHADSNVATNNGATYGAMGTVRAAKMADQVTDDSEYVRCEVFGWSATGTTAGRCTFVDANGVQTQCYSSSPAIVTAMTAIGDSRVTITLGAVNNGVADCASIIVMNSSEYAPKVP